MWLLIHTGIQVDKISKWASTRNFPKNVNGLIYNISHKTCTWLCFVLLRLHYQLIRIHVIHLPTSFRIVSPALRQNRLVHCCDVIMGGMVYQITSLTTIYSGADQRKHQSSASLALVREFTGDRWIPRTNGNNAENISIWWRHHGLTTTLYTTKYASVFLGMYSTGSFRTRDFHLKLPLV